jgi:hypothetical protein
MKRIIFYADVIIIAACFACSFAAIFWLLGSAIMTKISEAEFSVFATVLFLSLYVLLFSVLTVFMLFAAGFFIRRANIQYKKRSRSFTALQPDVTGGRKESSLSPACYIAEDLSGFVCFVPEPGMPFSNSGHKPHMTLVKGGRAAPGDPPIDGPGTFSPGLPAGKDDNIRPFPRGKTALDDDGARQRRGRRAPTFEGQE